MITGPYRSKRRARGMGGRGADARTPEWRAEPAGGISCCRRTGQFADCSYGSNFLICWFAQKYSLYFVIESVSSRAGYLKYTKKRTEMQTVRKIETI